MLPATTINLNATSSDRLAMLHEYLSRRQRVQYHLRGMLRYLVDHLLWVEEQIKETSLVPPLAIKALAIIPSPSEPFGDESSDCQYMIACEACVARMTLVNGAVHAAGCEVKMRHCEVSRRIMRETERCVQWMEMLARVSLVASRSGERN